MTHRFLIKLAVFALASNAAFGTIVFVTSPGSITDTTTWGQLGADGAAVPQNFNATSAGAVAVSGTLNGGAGLVSVICDPMNPMNCSWAPPSPGYNIGDSLIWAEDTNFLGTGPITLAFLADPQFGVGAYIQATSLGQFTGHLAVFNGVTLLGQQDFMSNLNGDALFVGAVSDMQEINRVVFSLTTCGGFMCDVNDFSMNTLQFFTVPEPSQVSMIALGMLAILGGIRRKNANRRKQ